MKSKFIGAIVGTAIGDAAGAPLEMESAQSISESYPDFVKDCDFVPAPTWTRRHKEGYQLGQWTDDTQLMIPTAWSIIWKGAIDPNDMSEQYVITKKEEPMRGWGGSTITSVENIERNVIWFEASESSAGLGTGAAMKAAPLGLLLAHVIKTESAMSVRHCMNSIIDVGKITHRELGVRAGLLQSILIALAYLEKPKDKILSDLEYCEGEFFSDTRFSRVIHDLMGKSIEEIANENGVGCVAEEAWVSTAAVFINSCSKPRDSSGAIRNLFTLIAQGGDCDTTGAMYGALIGARYGDKIFPTRLKKKLERHDELEKLGSQLYNELAVNFNIKENVWDSKFSMKGALNGSNKSERSMQAHL